VSVTETEIAGLTVYREALAELLARALEISFVPGFVSDTGIEGDWLGCTFPGRIEEVSTDLNVEAVVVYVRVYQPIRRQASVRVPDSPADLELVAEKIQDTLSTHQTSLGPWAQRVQRVEFNMRQMFLEATIHAVMDNRSINVDLVGR
jgi:hypothetical protein